MADIIGRYPLSTGDNQAIPLDIIRPEGLVVLAVPLNAPSSAFSLPENIDCFSIHSDIDSYIKFAGSAASATIPANAVEYVNGLFIPKGFVIIFSPPIDMRSVSATSIKGNGTVVIQYLQTWSGLMLKNQFERR